MLKIGYRWDYRPYMRTNHALSHLYNDIQCGLAHYGVSRAKDWVSVDCGTNKHNTYDKLITVINIAALVRYQNCLGCYY